MAGPLDGIRVLDLSRVVAGPWCTQILADLGADVIKVERPGSGDETRQWGPPWLTGSTNPDVRQSAYFLAVNRGKRSVTIDFGKQDGVDLVRRLAAASDIVIENFKVGALAAKGLAFDDLAKNNGGLIYCSITGYGQTGPMADLPGYDYLIQAQGGLMSVTGNADGEPGAGPKRVGVAISDLTTGMNAAIAILGALHHRDRTGEGQYIDLSLLDVQVSWLANQAQNYFVSGNVPGRTGDSHPNLAPYEPFPTRDGSLIIAVGNDRQFRRLCAALDAETLASDGRFATNAARVEHRDVLVASLRAETERHATVSLMQRLRDAGVPCGPIQPIDEVFGDPQVKARGMRVDIDHPQFGAVPTVASPIRYSRTALEYERAPPLLGEHTAGVLEELLGVDGAELRSLRARGII